MVRVLIVADRKHLERMANTVLAASLETPKIVPAKGIWAPDQSVRDIDIRKVLRRMMADRHGTRIGGGLPVEDKDWELWRAWGRGPRLSDEWYATARPEPHLDENGTLLFWKLRGMKPAPWRGNGPPMYVFVHGVEGGGRVAVQTADGEYHVGGVTLGHILLDSYWFHQAIAEQLEMGRTNPTMVLASCEVAGLRERGRTNPTAALASSAVAGLADDGGAFADELVDVLWGNGLPIDVYFARSSVLLPHSRDCGSVLTFPLDAGMSGDALVHRTPKGWKHDWPDLLAPYSIPEGTSMAMEDNSLVLTVYPDVAG